MFRQREIILLANEPVTSIDKTDDAIYVVNYSAFEPIVFPIRDISDQELISCLHDQFTIRHVHGGDSLYLYTLFKKSTFKC